MKVVILHLCAPNTPSGNPNRCFVAYDIVSGVVVGAWDEGYSGTNAIPDAVKSRVYGASSPLRISVAAREVKDFLKQGRAALAQADDTERRTGVRFK